MNRLPRTPMVTACETEALNAEESEKPKTMGSVFPRVHRVRRVVSLAFVSAIPT